MAGRKTKLTPQVQAIIVEAIAKGNDKVVAARLADIGETTFYAWLARGEQAKSGAFWEFREAVKKAEAEAEQYFVGVIKAATVDTWTAAAWWLERKHPDRWGRKERQQVEHEGGLTIRVVYEDTHPDAGAASSSADASGGQRP